MLKEETAKQEPVKQGEEDTLVVELSQTYEFEGKKIKEMDLRKLRDATANDMIKASRALALMGENSSGEETTLGYACALAGTVTDLPMEFYRTLKAPDALKLKNRVVGFLYGII